MSSQKIFVCFLSFPLISISGEQVFHICERISHSRNSEKNRLNEKNHTPLTHSHQTHEHASPTQHNLQAVALLFQELQIYMPNNHQKTDVKSYE
jgi:hypothetical protein